MKKTAIALGLTSAFALMTAAPAHADDHTASSPAHTHSHDAGASIGVAGRADHVTRTVVVTLSDKMSFDPAALSVRQGETIRFELRNAGQLKHEFVLGTDAELAEHYELMKKFPEMEHADDNAVTLAPGGRGEVIWQFTRSGKVSFACLQPGHYDAGMKGAVTVIAAAKAGQADSHDTHAH